MTGLWRLVVFALSSFGGDDRDVELSAAVRRATAKAASCIVRIETTGGMEIVGGVRRGGAPTTGLIVAADGAIISSSYNLANRPAGIVVTLPGGVRCIARVVGEDRVRMLTLLRIAADNLPTPIVAPKISMRAGQWAVALGKTWNMDKPSISVGIVSALHRLSGRAIQTDAKVSPTNYGGPLIDLEGRVLGVLAPLSAEKQDDAAGVEWYDSGIGFAVPLEDVLSLLPRLEKGDLFPGVLGVHWRAGDPLESLAVVERTSAGSPAALAGIQVGDTLLNLDGRRIRRLTDVREIIGSKYAGDSVSITLRRGRETLQRRVALTAVGN